MHLASLSQEQVDDYNTDLGKYFDEYENYLRSLYEFECQQQLSYSIKILLVNEGNVPAEEVDIHLHFPDGFELKEPGDLIKDPKTPQPPYRPKNRFDINPRLLSTPFLYSRLPDVPSSGMPGVNRPSIKKTNSYDVNMHRKYLKHSYTLTLDDLISVYEKVDSLKNFEINYEITAANMTEGVVGKLRVIFEKQV